LFFFGRQEEKTRVSEWWDEFTGW